MARSGVGCKYSVVISRVEGYLLGDGQGVGQDCLCIGWIGTTGQLALYLMVLL